jgi:hypothetical protein
MKLGIVVAASASIGATISSATSETCPPELKDFGEKGCRYKCESDLVVPVSAPSHKGLALDDTTLHFCPANMPFHWPNTDEPVTSYRMFKAWAGWWNEPWVNKEAAWKAIASHLEAVNGKVLVGTQISCSEEQDDEDWENVKAMMKILGPKRMMGLAIGNELELLWTKTSIIENLPECLDRMWNQEYFLKKFHARVQEMDAMGEGFGQITVTSVFGGFVLAEPGLPFYELCDVNDRCARVGTFINNVTQHFGDRYAHTINIYPYFQDYFIEYDQPVTDPPTCSKALATCKCLKTDDPDKCDLTWNVGRVRARLEGLGNADATLWLGETGWSAPKAETMDTKMQWCEEWSSEESFRDFYTNFLDWDLSMNGKYRGPDHVFYFTMRDSSNFGKIENFGLIGGGDPLQWCTNTTCKVQQPSLLSPPALVV